MVNAHAIANPTAINVRLLIFITSGLLLTNSLLCNLNVFLLAPLKDVILAAFPFIHGNPTFEDSFVPEFELVDVPIEDRAVVFYAEPVHDCIDRSARTQVVVRLPATSS